MTPASTKFMAVVKADGYGHGAIEIADVAVANGVDYLGVAWVVEAVQLREAGIKAPILILSEPTINVAADIVRLDVTQTVYSFQFAKALSDAAQQLNKTAKVHVKIDTGMGRIGVNKNEAVSLIEQIDTLDNIEIEGIFTHFANADEKTNEHTSEQLKEFNEILDLLVENGFTFPIIHAANTAATENFPNAHFNMVRVGIGLYKDVLTFKSKIAYIKRVKEGTLLSYGSTFSPSHDTNIATLSVGYADGLVRSLSNIGHVLINEKRYNIVGRICMDMTLVNLGDDVYPVGQEVVLIGQQGDNHIDVTEVASQANTIDYEILCGIGKRVNRIYIN
jgi:alanine racemase